MARFFRGRKKRLILDIGSSAIRLCELSQTKTGYQLTKYLQREYNSDPALEEDVRKNYRRKALAQILKDSRVRTKRTVFGVPGQSVFTRCRALPPVPERKVTQIVKYEIQQQIPFSLDQIAMDYQVLDRTEAGGYDVMMAAIKVDVVDKHIDILLEAKRTIDTVDVCPFAAYNWLKHSGEFGDTGDCIALIDIGASTTDIVIERESQFRFTRPLNVGGNDITQALSAAFGMTFGDAERLKRDRGFAPTGDPKKDGKGGEVIGRVLQRLVSEIQRSFSYFRSLPGGGQVNRVILCGGGACLRNIIPYMQRELGVEVRIAQPLAGLAIAPSAQQVSERPEQACIALGLALRCCETVPIEINLIPPRIVEIARRKEQAFYWAMSLAAVALIMASIIPVSANENKVVRQRIDSLKLAIHAYDPEMVQHIRPGAISLPASDYVNQLKEAKNDIVALEKDVKALDFLRETRKAWLDEMSLINDCRPSTGNESVFFSAMETISFSQGEAAQPGRRGGGRPADRSRGRAGRSGGASSGAAMTGFPGIEAKNVPAAGRGGRGGRGGEAAGGGRPGARRGGRRGQEAPDVNAIPRANGIKVHGFADSDTALKEFVSCLSNKEAMLPNGKTLRVAQVIFSESSVQKYSWDILMDAPLDDLGSRSGQDQVAESADGRSVYSFTIIVEFEGDSIEENPPPPAGDTAPGSGAPGPPPPGPRADAPPPPAEGGGAFGVRQPNRNVDDL
ncbi:MAG TPA: type IV pilus assembly protein PilM [Candidatus Hydrogenedentes bacterium]|nr:type IV pilus assembly protein PilM [Candidatus Hydrogenedentota bacterium]